MRSKILLKYFFLTIILLCAWQIVALADSPWDGVMPSSTAFLSYNENGKTGTCPDSGKKLVFDSAWLVNGTGSDINVGWGIKLDTGDWKAGGWDPAYTPVYREDTTDAQDSGTSDFRMGIVGVNNAGFIIQAMEPFDWVGVTVGTAGVGGTLAYYQCTGVNTWTAVTADQGLTHTSTGDQYLRVPIRPDWMKGGCRQGTTGLDSDKYALRVLFTSAPSTAPLATELWVISSRALYALEAGQPTSVSRSVILGADQCIVPLFEGTPSALNRATLHYRILGETVQ